MADTSYQPKTYRKDGGDTHVIANGGELVVEAGGELLCEDGTAAGAGLSPLIWSDCPRLQMLSDPTLGHFVGDDFTFTSTKSYTTAYDYTLSQSNAGTFAATASDPNGVALITATGTDNDAAYVNHAANPGILKMSATQNWWYEARVKISQITLAQGIFVGLTEHGTAMGTDFLATNTMELKVQDSFGFQVLSATDIAAVWQSCFTLAAKVVLDAALATATTGWVKLGIKSVLGAITIYINGVAVATTTTAATNFPLDKYMMPCFAVKTGDTHASALSVDWWYVAQLR